MNNIERRLRLGKRFSFLLIEMLSKYVLLQMLASYNHCHRQKVITNYTLLLFLGIFPKMQLFLYRNKYFLVFTTWNRCKFMNIRSVLSDI